MEKSGKKDNCKSMKEITFFTIHQAPHNTFIFRCLRPIYKLNIFYLKEKLQNYKWSNNEFYYPGSSKRNLFKYFKTAFKSDLVIISGWQNYRYIMLIAFLFLINKRFAIYLDLDINSLRRFGYFKKYLLRKIPIILITGIYGEVFLKRYLKKSNVFNFPYGVKSFCKEEINEVNIKRKRELVNGKIKVFISNRFIERKGYHLIRSLLTYLKENGIIHYFDFTIAGSGTLFYKEKHLIHKINKDVKFLGWIEYEEYRKQILNNDVYLHCSEYEPYGIPPVDAFTANKEIVLTSKVYSLYDIIEMGDKIWVFDYNKPNQLNSVFNEILKTKDILYVNKNCKDIDKYLFCSTHRINTEKMLNTNF